MAKFLKYSAVCILTVITLPVVSFIALSAYASISDNFHALPGEELYRSGQMNREELAEAIDTYHIKSVLNLRGGNYDESWYQDEVTLAKEKHVEHYDYALSSKREVPEYQARNVLGLIQNAPKPVLIHCEHGADRTGLVSALYMKYIRYASTEEAARQFSLKFAHASRELSGRDPMDTTFEKIANSPYFAAPPPSKGK